MMKNRVIFLVLLISLTFTAAGCRKGETANGYEKVEKSEFLMGTLVTIKTYDRDEEKASRAAEGALERIREIEALLSISKKESEVNRINQRAGVQPVSVSGDTINVVDRGIYYGGLSDGLFDVTVGPLVSLWGIGTEYQGVPGDQELDKALALIDYRDVEVNREAGEVYLRRPGMGLDLGGIAKGYAADEAKKLLESAGIKHAIINLGGNVLTVGARYDGGPWNIGIKDPEEPADSLLGMARIIGKTIVTSGDYERYFEEDGRRYHHILDPFTGYPGKSEIRGVTIITSSSIDADALSTTVFLLGPEEGMQLIESLEGVEAVIVTDNRQVVLSSGIKDTFSLLKANYKIRQVGAK
jgi:thiamine biosynthesis lipoprotein